MSDRKDSYNFEIIQKQYDENADEYFIYLAQDCTTRPMNKRRTLLCFVFVPFSEMQTWAQHACLHSPSNGGTRQQHIEKNTNKRQDTVIQQYKSTKRWHMHLYIYVCILYTWLFVKNTLVIKDRKKIADIYDVAMLIWVILTILELGLKSEKWQRRYCYSTNRNKWRPVLTNHLVYTHLVLLQQSKVEFSQSASKP